MDTKVIKVERASHVAAAADQGARALKAGKLVAFATETVYGLAALASNTAAMKRLRDLKDRPKMPFTVHLGRPEDVNLYVAEAPPAAYRLIERAWPGPITLLLETGGKLADKKLQKAGLAEVLCYKGVIGLRCPDERLALEMLKRAGAAVVAPSANLAGRPSPRSAQDVLAGLDGKIDLVIDTGAARLGQDSTIVAFGAAGWKLLRKGPYDDKDVRRMMRRKVLFVCTGNTCRSPMAAGLARQMLAQREGCRVGELRGNGLEVASAGVFAAGGSSATPEAIAAAKRLGADISRHRSRKLTPELINSCDVIFCMTAGHARRVRQMSDEVAERVSLLLENSDVDDPIGGGEAVYDRTAQRIADALKKLLDRKRL